MPTTPIRVLLVDPDPVALAASARVLHEAGIEVVAQAATGEEAVRLGAAAQPTVVVIDVALGGMGAATATRRLRDVVGHRLDIVAQASFSGVSRIGEMVSTGAAAFVVKGRFGDLVAAVRAVTAGSGLLSSEVARPLLEEIQRLYEAEQEKRLELEKTVARLQAVTITDWLTGLKNHGYFWQRLGEELQRARRYDRPLAVIMADLDDFKAVNDEFGHSIGDEVLRATGEAMTASVRESDIACRVGGEEFAIIVPETSAVGALQAAERVREAVMEINVAPVGGVTISLGVAVFPFHATEGRELVEAADRALYDAKHAGKNCSRIAGGPTTRSATAVDPYGPAVSAFLSALELRGPQFVRHAERVADLCSAIGTHMKLPAGELENLRLAALLHDVGMIGVPDTILDKTGPLGDEERERLALAPQRGGELLAQAVPAEVVATIAALREGVDGPAHSIGGSVLNAARVLAVADAYDAMRTDKPYRAARGEAEAIAELRRHATGRFDPAVIDALEEVLKGATTAQVIQFPA